MAGILDPKSRFFDTFLTAEGRRQLGSGELRMRFVSFSDGYTSYDESPDYDGVIESKDGEIFFEAMSRPQDSIVTENPSIVNALELRNPSAQPSFMSREGEVRADSDGRDNDGDGEIDESGETFFSGEETKPITLSNAAMFGEEIFVPPSGKNIESVRSAGIDRAYIDFDATKKMYVSGSDSREIYYSPEDTGLVGYWVFDRSIPQPAAKPTQSTLHESFPSTPFVFTDVTGTFNIVKLEIKELDLGANSNHTAEFSSGGSYLTITKNSTKSVDTGIITVGQVLRILNRYYSPGSTITVEDANGVSQSHITLSNPAGEENDQLRSGISAALAEGIAESAEFSTVNSPDNYTLSHTTEPISFLAINDNVSQNLSSSSYFGTNASYMVKTDSYEYMNGHSNKSSPSFSDSVFLSAIASEDSHRKSYSSTSDSYIRIALDEYLYGRTSQSRNHPPGKVFRPTQADVGSNLGYPDNSDCGNNKPNPLPSEFSDVSGAQSFFRWVNQFSVWFYIKQSAFDSGNTQTIASFYASPYIHSDSGSVLRAKIYTISNSISLNLYDEEGNIVSLPGTDGSYSQRFGDPNSTIESPIKPDTWHRISFVYGSYYDHSEQAALSTNRSYAFMILDGKLSSTFPGRTTFGHESALGVAVPNYSSKLLNFSTVILGNCFENSDGTPASLEGPLASDEFLDGYIQSCEYFAKKISGDFIERDEGDNDFKLLNYKGPPAFGDTKALESYISFKQKLSDGDFSTSSTPGLIEPQDDTLIRDMTQGGEGSLVRVNNETVSTEEVFRRWIDYTSIAPESVLYFGGLLGGAYVKETQIDKGMVRADINDIVSISEQLMSGSLFAYNELRLLGHFDSEVEEDQRGLEVKRYSTTTESGALERTENTIPTGNVRIFTTRKNNLIESAVFPDREPVYGQSPIRYRDDNNTRVKRIEEAEGKITGKIFQKEATVYHLEEIIDNNLDRDDTTVSSTRVPNFFFLPPIGSTGYFTFDGVELEDGSETIENVMSFRKFLARRAANLSVSLQGISSSGRRQSREENMAETLRLYKKYLRSYYKSLIPEKFTDNILSTLGMDGENVFSDSHEHMIKYMIRDLNDQTDFGNPVNFPIGEFSELIEFTKTSERNNSFIQMFEVSNDEGKAKFRKLAIRDLGIIKKSVLGDKKTSPKFSREKNLVSNPDFKTLLSKAGSEESYSHVFVFGKIIDKTEMTSDAGSAIYFTPIFSLELEIE